MSASAGPIGSAGAGRGGAGLAGLALATAAAFVPGCYAPQIALLKSGLDSLRTVVDTLVVRDAVAYAVLSDARRQIVEQRDVLLSTRATAGTTTQQLFDQMGRLQTRLDEVLTRFHEVSQRAAPPAAAPGSAPQGPAPDPAQFYDQAALDLTQGRYPLALQGFREFLRRFPTAELADNAQYGIGECFFAQAKFDSAAVEYTRLVEQYPKGDRVPAALYKLALSQENLGKTETSRKTLKDLVKRFPQSGEAQLARERLGSSGRR